MQEKKALARETSKRYQKADKKGKGIILTEFVNNTKYNRKYAIHILANWGKTKTTLLDGKPCKLKAATTMRQKGGGRKPIYSGEFAKALEKIWVFFWYRCGREHMFPQILAPFVREHMRFLEKPFKLTVELTELLQKVSPATIDRVLKPKKKELALKGKSGTKPASLLKKQIPIRTYCPDEEKKPGFFQTDTVHHCGTSDSGEFNLTLAATDVSSGWIELRPTLNKASKWVYEGLDDIRAGLPFPFLGMNTDNGSEYINKPLLKWSISHGILFTRSRPHRKNDNCYVEQKNHSCVRNIVGYYRFDTAAERVALAVVYRSLCPLLNYFMPAQKLLSKTRVGSKIKKVYDKKVLSPYQRLMASPDLADEHKEELARRFAMYDPVKLQQKVHDAVATLMALNRAKNLEGTQALAALTLQAQ